MMQIGALLGGLMSIQVLHPVFMSMAQLSQWLHRVFIPDYLKGYVSVPLAEPFIMRKKCSACCQKFSRATVSLTALRARSQ